MNTVQCESIMLRFNHQDCRDCVGSFSIHFILDQRFLFEGLVVCCKNTMIWFLIFAVSINFVEDCNVEWTRKYLHNRYSNIFAKSSQDATVRTASWIDRYWDRKIFGKNFDSKLDR